MDKTSIQSLEGDGILEDFYQLLWVRDPMFGTIPSIHVPDTVFYKFDQPEEWYFAYNTGVRKKMKSKLTNEEVEKAFLKNVPECGIVAMYFYYIEEQKQKRIVFEYLDVEEFKKWLKSKKQYNGILQRFVQPKGDRNFILRAIWSSKLCFLEKIENFQKFSNDKIDLYERAVTIDGKSHHAHSVPLRGYVLPSKIERICNNISQHLKNCSMEKILINRLVLNFKLDPEGRIWLLFASSLRLNMDKKLNEKRIYSVPRVFDASIVHMSPDFVNTSRVSNPTKPYNLQRKEVCASCHTKLGEGEFVPLKYEHIIKGFDYDHLLANEPNFVKNRNMRRDRTHPTVEEAIKTDIKFDRLQPRALEVENYEIPPLLAKIHPNLRMREYRHLKLEPGFWKKEVTVCEGCYLSICQSIIESGSVDEVKHPNSKIKFIGTGALKPENVSRLRNMTMYKIQDDKDEEVKRLDEEAKRLDEEERAIRTAKSNKFRSTSSEVTDRQHLESRKSSRGNRLKPLQMSESGQLSKNSEQKELSSMEESQFDSELSNSLEEQVKNENTSLFDHDRQNTTRTYKSSNLREAIRTI